jgi:hypothetical protein
MYHRQPFVLALCLAICTSAAFSFQASRPCRSCVTSLQVVKDLDRPSTFLDDNDDDEDSPTIEFIDGDDDDEDDDDDDDGDGPVTKPSSRWQSLNPKIKQRLIEKGQAKAIANKAKREPKLDKKRRKQSNPLSTRADSPE